MGHGGSVFPSVTRVVRDKNKIAAFYYAAQHTCRQT